MTRNLIPAPINSLICMGCRYKKRTLAVLFLIVELTIFIQDKFGGGSHWSIYMAAFLLSLLNFVITLNRFTAKTRVPAE